MVSKNKILLSPFHHKIRDLPNYKGLCNVNKLSFPLGYYFFITSDVFTGKLHFVEFSPPRHSKAL